MIFSNQSCRLWSEAMLHGHGNIEMDTTCGHVTNS